MTKKRWIIAGITIIIVIIAVTFVIILFHAPSKSVVRQPTVTKETTPKIEAPVSVDTAYFTATLPSGFAVRTREENATSQDVMQIVATKVGSNGQQIAINVATVGSDGLPGVASYNLRAKNPTVYTQTEFGGMPAGVPTFYNQSSSAYEITGFWPRGGLYASISVSGAPNDGTTINNLYSQVLDSWRWR